MTKKDEKGKIIIGDNMKSKEKSKKHIRYTLKNIICFLFIIISILYIVIFYNFYFVRNKVYATQTVAQVENVKISNANQVDINAIIDQNSKKGMREEYIVEEVELEYITTYKDNSDLPKGTIQVIQEGREGKQEITKKRTYQEQELISEEQINAKVTKGSVNKIVEIGTGRGTNKYKAKVGDILYVTSDRLSVMVEPSEDSMKIGTLQKKDELKVLEIKNEWYKISCQSVTGYVKSESTTYINPNENISEDYSNTQEKSKSQLISTLSFNMELNKPSGLTLEQFKKVLTDSKDTNKIFEQNAQYFYYIEKQYNINGIFVASVGIHESAWGTSKIANNKSNLFGYGAYDSNPYNGAYTFNTYSESIDLLARVFVKYYLNPKGTKIYGGEVASGKYYNGPTLSGVNSKYASDKNWASGVFSYMKYLYNKL